MGLTSVQPSHAPQTASKVTKTDGGDQSRATSPEWSNADTVQLSDHGRNLSKLSGALPPTADDVRRLSAGLAANLQTLFSNASVDVRNGVGIDVNSRTGRISIQNDRPDAQTIAALIAGHAGVARQINEISTLSAHVAASDKRFATSLAAQTAQIGDVVANYAPRFGDRPDTRNSSLTPIPRAAIAPEAGRGVSAYAAVSSVSGATGDIAIRFDGTTIQVGVDGKPWISSLP